MNALEDQFWKLEQNALETTDEDVLVKLCIKLSIATKRNGTRVSKTEIVQKILAKEQELIKKPVSPTLQVSFIGDDWECGMTIHALNERISKENWNKIAKEMYFVNTRDDEGEAEWNCDYRGWAIGDIQFVEIVLGILPENRLLWRRKLAKEQKKRHDELITQRDSLLTSIRAAFEKAEYPTDRQYNPEGETLEDPAYPHDIYGGGHWWVITPEYIWFIQNNGMDGDDWSRNNIRTGGAGAIGHRIPYSHAVHQLINDYVSTFTNKERA